MPWLKAFKSLKTAKGTERWFKTSSKFLMTSVAVAHCVSCDYQIFYEVPQKQHHHTWRSKFNSLNNNWYIQCYENYLWPEILEQVGKLVWILWPVTSDQWYSTDDTGPRHRASVENRLPVTYSTEGYIEKMPARLARTACTSAARRGFLAGSSSASRMSWKGMASTSSHEPTKSSDTPWIVSSAFCFANADHRLRVFECV